MFAAASAAGRGNEDFSAAAQFLADLAGVQFSRAHTGNSAAQAASN